MATSSTDDLEPRFNDDLLANPEDVERAGKLYSELIHVLDHPELRAYFKTYDDKANAAKERSRNWGITAIVLGAFALLGTSAEIVIPETWRTLVAIISAIFGILSVVIGMFGILHHRAKREWLYRRLMTERLRQFHFQTIACRWPEVLDSLNDEKAKTNYYKKREVWFERFKSQFEGHLSAQFTSICDGGHRIWLHEIAQLPTNEVNMDGLFDAYLELRIMHQSRYADLKLSNSSKWKTSRGQAAFFTSASLICIATIFLIHLAIAIAIPLDSFKVIPHGVHDFLQAGWTNFITIWLAIAALAIRALEEGLRPGREIERYLHYSSDVRAIADKFRAETSSAKKIDAMREMERLSFDEMANFLRTHDEARFVM